MNLEWSLKKFEELYTWELYAILSLRSRVFVVEQDCVYLDTDGIDLSAWHLCGWDGKTLAGYARVIPPGIVYPQASIGRVVTDPAYRKTGTGRALMQKALAAVFENMEATEIKIGAQLYLESFYTSLGFTKISETYIEDGIPHIHMLCRK